MRREGTKWKRHGTVAKALEWSGKALYWVTIGPIIELIKLIFGIA